jgi:hypothetical protein
MSVILEWLIRQVIWIAVICLIGAFGYVVSAVVAKRQRDTAQFTLEREVYHHRMSRAWFVAGLFLALGSLVFAVSIMWIPSVAMGSSATRTPSNGLFTLTPGPRWPTPSAGTPGAGTQVVVSAPESLGTTTPLVPATGVPAGLLQPVCPSSSAQVTYPVAGSALSGMVDVVGTALVNAFSYYRFEVIFPGSTAPTFVAQYEQAVENGSLGSWDISDPTRFPPGGPYRFQLVVVDIYGNTTTCTIPIDIVAESDE